jgi:hypothetical protein
MPCPVCKAENSQGPTCRRCKADLSLLWQLERRREALLGSARECFRRGQWQNAERAALAAVRLRHGGDAGRLIALCRLFERDFSGAWQAYQSVNDDPPSEQGSKALS